MDRNGRKILKLLEESGYMTAGAMADALDISAKTVRLRIKDLNYDGQKNGFEITAKPRVGYQLEIYDKLKWEQYISEDKDGQGSLPNSTEERTDFLLAYLLYRKNYIKIDELCDFLFVSRKTLSQSLKQVEHIINSYNIVIDRRPGLGLKMLGEEYDFRRCIVDYFVGKNVFGNLEEHKNRQLASLKDTVLSILRETGVHMTETSMEAFVYYIYVAIKRIKSGFPVLSDCGNSFYLTEKEQECIDWLTAILSQRWQIEMNANEKSYIMLHLACKRMIEAERCLSDPFLVNKSVEKTGERILDVLLDEFNVNLKGDSHIRMMIHSHLIPFEMRILNEVSHKNELLPEIKQNYAFPYTMASRVGEVLEEQYKKPVSEDEVGYFAMIFALALEKMKGNRTKKSDILIVCNSGKGSSGLLKYQYEKEFADYLNSIYVCDMVGLNRFDFSKVEYVFTTVPIGMKLPVPVIEVGTFLEISDIVRVKNILKTGRGAYLSRIYRPERFFIGLKGKDKTEVLKNFCAAIARREKLPEGFLESVLKREELGQTDFGNLVAMPHPYKLLEDETKAFVGVLERPVQWTKNPVQVVFLVSVGKHDENLPIFYEATAKAMGDKTGVDKLILSRQFDTLMEMLENTV